MDARARRIKQKGYNAGDQYDPDTADGFSGANYFPDKMSRRKFYQPVERGFEREIAKRLAYWDTLRKEKNAGQF